MTLSQLKRRIAWAVISSFLAGFLTFMSVTFQAIEASEDAIETCHQLSRPGFHCMWSDKPFNEYGTRVGDDK
jgi:hypothetical protein